MTALVIVSDALGLRTVNPVADDEAKVTENIKSLKAAAEEAEQVTEETDHAAAHAEANAVLKSEPRSASETSGTASETGATGSSTGATGSSTGATGSASGSDDDDVAPSGITGATGSTSATGATGVGEQGTGAEEEQPTGIEDAVKAAQEAKKKKLIASKNKEKEPYDKRDNVAEIIKLYAKAHFDVQNHSELHYTLGSSNYTRQTLPSIKALRDATLDATGKEEGMAGMTGIHGATGTGIKNVASAVKAAISGNRTVDDRHENEPVAETGATGSIGDSGTGMAEATGGSDNLKVKATGAKGPSEKSEITIQGAKASVNGVSGDLASQTRQIVKKLPKDSTHTSILAYMDMMEEDAKKMQSDAIASYEPIALNCSLNRVAYIRTANHTQRILNAIKSNEEYENETAKIQSQITQEIEKVAAWKETYRKATKDQIQIQYAMDNSTVSCLGHFNQHKRMLSTLHELERSSKRHPDLEPMSLLESSETMTDSLKEQVLSMISHEQPSPEALSKAFTLLVNTIRTEKEKKSAECEANLKTLDAQHKNAKETHTLMHKKITRASDVLLRLKQTLTKKLLEKSQDNKKANALERLTAKRDKEFKELEITCNKNKFAHEDEMKNLKTMVSALALVRESLASHQKSSPQTVLDMAEKELKRKADEALKEGVLDENADDKAINANFASAPMLRKHLQRLKKNGQFQGTSIEDIESGNNLGGIDAHGCNIGAGYSFCKSSKRCQRLWEEPCYYQGDLKESVLMSGDPTKQ
jgi:hypothetical protein